MSSKTHLATFWPANGKRLRQEPPRLVNLSHWLLSVLLVGSSLFPASQVWANSALPNTVIQNQATGSFFDPTDNSTQTIESNQVTVTVVEVAGITVSASTNQPPTEAPNGVTSAGPNQGDGIINTEDVVYFTFDITNVGNDPTQFFIPDSVRVTNGTFSRAAIGPIQIIAYDTDGATPVTLTTPEDVPTGGITTGAALGLPNGAIAPNGTLTVRVPVKAQANLAANAVVTVVLGDTAASDRNNQPYSAGGNNVDLYTQDNQDTDTVDVLATTTVETESAGPPSNGDTVFHRQEASATQSTPIAIGDNTPTITGGPFVCDSTLYISISPDDGTNQQLYDVDRIGQIYTFNPIGPPTNAGSVYPNTFDYNGLAYNPIDNYMYAYIYRSDSNTGPYSPGNVIKIGNDGIAQSLGIPVGPALGGNYYAGTILSDQTYVVGAHDRFAAIDISTTPPTVVHAEQTVPGLYLNDLAVDPRVPVSIAGSEVYAINEFGANEDRLIILDVTTFPPTVVNEAQNPTGFNHNAGSQFVDPFGTLYYRSGDTNDIYEVDTDENSPTYGVATRVTSAPPGYNHDGLSCLFAIGMNKKVLDTNNNPIESAPAGTVVRYTYEIASGNIVGLTGVTFEDDLRNVASGIPLNSTFVGEVTVSNGSGDVAFSNDGQTLQIDNLVLPAQSPATPEAELIVITADVLLNEDLSPDVYSNQAFLSNLPPQYPPVIPSDSPETIPYQDPTELTVTESIASDPNLRLVKRITALNRDLANEQTFDTSYVDIGTPSDNDNAADWPGPSTPATVGSGTVESYLPGIVNASDSNITTRSGDQIEYTISFLSDGDVATHEVLICDRIPAHTTFVSDAYNTLSPSQSGEDRGILINFNGTETALTNASDGDEIMDTGANDGVGGYYFPPGEDPSLTFPGINCGLSNDNGALVVDFSDIPNATGDGLPANAYGFIRFRTRVN